MSRQYNSCLFQLINVRKYFIAGCLLTVLLRKDLYFNFVSFTEIKIDFFMQLKQSLIGFNFHY